MTPTATTAHPPALTDAWLPHLNDAISALRLRLFVSGGDDELERALRRVEVLLRRHRELGAHR